jgi:prepilin-type N-terminal cleavage/methylation domain-containing protein
MQTFKRAFSLVELSIVLVILGLLVGGVLSGQSLIRAAELRSVTTTYSTYAAAVRSFQDKYFALPGDMTNATQFWGSAGGTGADAVCFAAQTSAARNTCNGNGDGRIFGVTGVVYGERFASWKHLANAGLIEGSYTGSNGDVPASSTYVAQPGTNVPAAKLSQGFFDTVYEVPNTGNYATATAVNVNVIAIYGAGSTTFGILKPEEAWNIDTKLDDGSPVYGKVFANKKTSPVGTDCASSDADNATYDFTQTGKNCNLKIAIQ